MPTSRDIDNLILDKMAYALKVIDYEHAEIHSGDHYFVAGYNTFDSDEDIDFQVTTPNTLEYTHMRFNIQATGAVVFSVYEDATVGSGSSVTPYNNNRNSSNTSGLTVQTDGAVSVAGTKIFSQAFGVSGNPAQRFGGDLAASFELVLKANSTYRFFIESDTNSNIISYQGFWYEHTGR